MTAAPRFLTAALYKFVELSDFAELQAPLLAFCEARDVKGTLLLAPEGINGTIAGPAAGVYEVLNHLRSDPRLANLEHKESWSDTAPFYRMKVKLRKEIVTLGVEGINPTHMAGKYVKPQEWNDLISDPNVVLIDTRNDYEVNVGSFKGAINPHTTSFSELPNWVKKEMGPNGSLAASNGKKPKVAMFCTGGIRCEKSTAFLRTQGFDEVYHLEGGILKYLETVPEQDSTWLGECFVFDERVSVGHGLKPGHYHLCRSCRNPVSEQDKQSPLYVEGVSCPSCHGTKTDTQKQGFVERQRQIALAKSRNEVHIGAKRPKPMPKLEQPTILGNADDADNATLPVLYSFRRCPYAIRARLALAASKVTYEHREVILRNKPAAMLQASPKATVPVLVLPSGQVIDESLDIMQWALAQNDPAQWLAPAHSAEGALAERASNLIAANDGAFKRSLDRYKYPHRYENEWRTSAEDFARQHRDSGGAWLLQLESMLQNAWLFGTEPSWIDMALLPFVRQFAHVDAAWFAAQAWPRVATWLAKFEASALFENVMQKHPVWQGNS